MLELPPLVDAHCHGVVPGEIGLGSFEAHLPGAAAPGTTLFDSRTGFALRRWCPPLLDLEPHCTPARYLAGRRQLGTYEATRRLLRGTGIGTYLVDTAVDAASSSDATSPLDASDAVAAALPRDLTAPRELGAAGAAAAYEIVRLEPLAQQVADTSGTVGAFLANVAEAVHGAARTAVAFSAAGAWPPGLPAGPPEPGPVRRAAGAWLANRPAGGRLTDPVLLSHLVWNAVATGLPLQIRGPAGADPLLLTGFLRATTGLGTDVVLLHGIPDHRHTARLAATFPHVYADIGSASAAPGVMAEVLELAPFGKVLFSTGAYALPELYVTGVRFFREALDRLVTERVTAGAWTPPDARRVAAMVAGGNARRVYGLRAPSDGGGHG
ncbi:amidohydrolase family protein [Streptomyces sp. H10-C2]|uniref:amidohydrolase family protein n=1 Tax=unclassified Streptomyces TaxID=2593676 RepID=UPI0024B90FED|nr:MULTISPECIES: amidohydrolase family protein [unclassified Streptomyces]MDJ0345451.1 amidohydrolase family protein [Streptomyces sp. PH10-H1]MDJ0374285.1 amidohydrolase family protein [Streptomyces sp. H10-C2]